MIAGVPMPQSPELLTIMLSNSLHRSGAINAAVWGNGVGHLSEAEHHQTGMNPAPSGPLYHEGLEI